MVQWPLRNEIYASDMPRRLLKWKYLIIALVGQNNMHKAIIKI